MSRGLASPVLVALAGIALLAAAAVVFLTTRWDAPVSEREPEAIFSAGPYAPGDSFEQRFSTDVNLLSNLRVALRAEPADAPTAAFDLLFRLYDGNRVVREGIVEAPGLGRGITPVRWDFAPLENSAGRELRVQAVVGANARQPVFAVTSLTDYLPGSLISNGTPTGPHIDLSLVPGRRLYPTRILAVMGDRYPLGAAGLVAGAIVLGVVCGCGLIALRGPRSRRRAERLAWLSLGVGLTAITASLVIRSVGGDPVPESGTDFWTRIAVLVVAVAVVPWSLAALRVWVTALAVLYLASFGLRAAILNFGLQAPWTSPASDAGVYLHQAHSFASQGVITPTPLGDGVLAVLLSPFILVWGSLPGLVVVAWFLAAVTSFAPVLLALLAEKCKVSRPMALAAGTALGISALYADWSLRSFPDALGLVLVLGVLLLWLRDSRRWIHGAGLGLLLGLAIANKPTLMWLALWLPLIGFVTSRRLFGASTVAALAIVAIVFEILGQRAGTSYWAPRFGGPTSAVPIGERLSEAPGGFVGISSQLASLRHVGPWSSEQRWSDWMPEWLSADFLVPLAPPSGWFWVDGAAITAGLLLIILIAYVSWKSKELRTLWLAIVPLWILLAMAFRTDAQPRHLLPLIAVVFVSLALVADRLTERWRPGRYAVAVSVLVPALILVSSQLASSFEYRSGEAAYLSGLAGHGERGTIVLAASRADPWLTHAVTGLPVVYDASQGGVLTVSREGSAFEQHGLLPSVDGNTVFVWYDPELRSIAQLDNYVRLGRWSGSSAIAARGWTLASMGLTPAGRPVFAVVPDVSPSS